MMTAAGPKVLEYNARFGDPETQAMLRLLDSDLAEIFLACTRGTLATTEVRIRPGFACNVVVAAGGYPDSYRKGDVITIGSLSDGVFRLLRRLLLFLLSSWLTSDLLGQMFAFSTLAPTL